MGHITTAMHRDPSRDRTCAGAFGPSLPILAGPARQG